MPKQQRMSLTCLNLGVLGFALFVCLHKQKEDKERFWKGGWNKVGVRDRHAWLKHSSPDKRMGQSIIIILPLNSTFVFLFCLFCFIFWLLCPGCGILVPSPGIEPVPPGVEAWSLNHWTTREVLHFCFSIYDSLQLSR